MLAAALLSAAALAERPVTDFVAAVQACVAAQESGRMDEQYLLKAGWTRKTSVSDEVRNKLRSFSHDSAAPIYTALNLEGDEGCTVIADAPATGGQPAVFAAFDATFGSPATAMTLAAREMRVWHLPHDHIMYLGRDGAAFSFVITHTFSGTSE